MLSKILRINLIGAPYSSNSPFQKGAYPQTPDQKQVINYKEDGKLLLHSQYWQHKAPTLTPQLPLWGKITDRLLLIQNIH